jgi:hypothetical protein
MKLISRPKVSGRTITALLTRLEKPLISCSLSTGYRILHPRDRQQRLLRQSCDIQKQCQSRRATKHKLSADFKWMVLANRSSAGEISQQHYRAGSSFHQEVDTTDGGVQISLCNTGRHRSRPHDPQATFSDVGPTRLQAICGSRWITVSSQNHESAVRQNFRQNLRSCPLQYQTP